MIEGNTVVVHDGTVHPGGAVDVVLEAARALDSDLLVGVSGMDKSWWAKRAPNDIRVLKFANRRSTIRDALLSHKMLKLDLKEYDLVLTSGPAAKFYQTYDDQTRYHYLHHPPLPSLWFDGGLFSYLVKTVDRIETWAVEGVICNSELTARRCVTQYSREPDAVINPPVDVERFRTDRERERGAVVMVGRLEARKRVELAVDAFDGIGEVNGQVPQLHLLGDGPLRSTVESRAPANVHVHGFVSDKELTRRVEAAEAGLFLAEREDFGITPIEYMAAGTPVVGVDEPNTNNQVVDTETGTLVDPTVVSVRAGVRRALTSDWDRDRIREASTAYGVEAFRTGLVNTLRPRSDD